MRSIQPAQADVEDVTDVWDKRRLLSAVRRATAADKSWAFNTTYRLHLYNYNIIGGKPNFSHAGTADSAIDGEEAPRNANFRDNEVAFHFEQRNPYLPYFSIGLRKGAGRPHIGRRIATITAIHISMLKTPPKPISSP